MEKLQKILESIDGVVWGPVTLILLVGTGVFLTFRLRFIPWKMLPKSLKAIFSPEARKTNGNKGDISPFSALMTALAGTI
ncbi:MAG: sodium:alanine symporter family protein, partial [Eubacterium sp.]|nr:sodium:alanine symporter family protein [Eubacterium sp.]